MAKNEGLDRRGRLDDVEQSGRVEQIAVPAAQCLVKEQDRLISDIVQRLLHSCQLLVL